MSRTARPKFRDTAQDIVDAEVAREGDGSRVGVTAAVMVVRVVRVGPDGVPAGEWMIFRDGSAAGAADLLRAAQPIADKKVCDEIFEAAAR